MKWQDYIKNPNLIQTGLFIDGAWISVNRDSFKVDNPATGEIIATMSKASLNDLEHALSSSVKAFELWKQVGVKDRSNLLLKWHDLIMQNIDDLAIILTIEQGKSLLEAKNEIIYGASYLKWYSEEAKRIYGYTVPSNNQLQRLIVNKEPVGVCGAITPWNFPNAMICRKIAPALASGCTMIIKPASQTPLSANALAYLALEAGIPKGVFNLVHGDSHLIGKFLCDAPEIRKLSFTGSTEVGVELYRNCAATMKKLSLELGGNAPFIVFEDANLDKAASAIIQSKFRNSGQTCVCSNRIFVHKQIKAELLEKLKQEMTKLKLGNGLDKDINQGPLIDARAVDHANKLLLDAQNKGGKVIIGGGINDKLGGLFFNPTLVDCIDSNVQMFSEEIFAPILAVYSFDNDDEVIKLANQTQYGLASYFFSSNVARVYKVAEALQYGIVGVNTGIISNEAAPFGGIKMSGLGREGGQSGMEEYLVEKYICLDLS